MFAYRPEVVDKHVEDTEEHDQDDGTELGLETDDDHDTSHKPNQADQHSPEAPFTCKDEADEEEDQKHSSSELNVHLLVLFINRGQSSKYSGLLDKAISEHHEQATNDGQVAEEEVQIENEAVSECLNNHDRQQTADCVLSVAAHDDQH